MKPNNLAFVLAVSVSPAPAVINLNEQLTQFRKLGQLEISESRKVDELLRKKAVDVDKAPSIKSEPDQFMPRLARRLPIQARLEWVVRSPQEWPSLQLEELATVTDSLFLNDLLWAYLQGQTSNFIQVRHASWPVLYARLNAFIKPRIALLQTTEHAAWWHWFAGEAVADPFADSRLRGLEPYLLALKAKDSDQQIEHLIEARYALSSHPLSQPLVKYFDREVAANFFETIGREKALDLIAWFAKVKSEYIYLRPKIALLENLRHILESKRFRDAAVASYEMQTRFANALALEDETPRAELEFAEYLARLNQPALALSNYLKATRAKSGLESWELIDAYRGAGLAALSLAETAKIAEQKSLREWAAEFFRKALNTGLSTGSRDEILISYARTLGQLGYWKPSFDVFEALFSGGVTKEVRLTGLTEGLKSLNVGLAQNLSEKNATIVLRRYLGLLVFYTRTPFDPPTLLRLTTDAGQWVDKLALKNNPVILATLRELQAKARVERK